MRRQHNTIGKKGVMYTIVALILLLSVGVIFFTQARRTGEETADASAARVTSVNDFINNFETDSERAAYIAGFRSFIAMEQYVTSSGSFIPNPTQTFQEVFLNGTINQSSFIIMQNSTFTEYIARVQANAAAQGILLNATVTNITLWQVDPWTVLVNYTLQMNVTDTRGTATWNINTTLVGRIPITNLRDPLFSAYTYGRIQRIIIPTNITIFVNGNDTTGLMNEFNNSLYLADGRGPTMLMRFAGNLSNNQFGIESLIDTDDFVAQNIQPNLNATIVDYMYFQNVSANWCTIQNLPTKMIFDASSLGIYQINKTLTYSNCT